MTLDLFTRSLTGSSHQPIVAVARRYPATPGDVWSAVTELPRLERWLGSVTDGPGGGYEIRFVDAPDRPVEAHVEECLPPERLVARWTRPDGPPSRVTLTLADDGGGTMLTLEHILEEFTDDIGGTTATAWTRWETALASLIALFGGEVPDVDADTWRRITRHPLEIVVDLAASPDEVWRALTTVDGLRRWWWNHWSDVEIAADVRAGGHYRFAAPGAGIVVEGTYLHVTPAAHLSFTWRWTDADGTSTDEACDIGLTGTDAGSRLTLRHSGPWEDDAPAEGYRQGWTFVFAALERALTAADSPEEPAP